jgi:hypothetical protein
MSQEVTVKATPVMGLAEFARKELTPQQFESVLDRIPPEERHFFTEKLLAQGTVPLSAVNRFTEAAAAVKGESVELFARRAGRYGAEIGLKTVYKFMMSLLSIQSVLKAAPLMWKRVYDGGELSVEPREQSATIRLRNFPSHPAGCGRITGWFELIGEKSGAKNLRATHVTCMSRGASECLWEFEWSS